MKKSHETNFIKEINTMKNQINNNHFEYLTKHQAREDNINFNDLVLEYLKKNKPDGTLEQLLTEIKKLSPQATVTMQNLNSALLYSNASLRTDPYYVNYTTDTLDSRTNQLLGLNMFTSTMLNNISRFYNENKDSDLA